MSDLPDSRKAARDAGGKHYFTGKPCKRGHVAKRCTRSGICVTCRPLYKKRSVVHLGRVERAAARSTGAKHYFTGLPCKNGHVAKRFTSDSTCTACGRERSAAKYRQGTEEFRCKVRAAVRTRDRARREQNPEKFAEENACHAALRRAALAARRPLWLSDEHKSDIRGFYQKARMLKAKTGEDYHVDHIVPLVSKVVSGLHVPWNLQVLRGRENRAKSNKLTQEDLT